MRERRSPRICLLIVHGGAVEGVVEGLDVWQPGDLAVAVVETDDPVADAARLAAALGDLPDLMPRRRTSTKTG